MADHRDRESIFERAGDELRSMFRDEGSGARGSHLDSHYARWRERQIDEFDRDYHDYRRERQQRFESDFDTWRQGRGSMGGSGIASGRPEGAGTPTGGSGTEPMASGGADAQGAASLSAAEASTGSNPRTGRPRKGRR